MCISMRPHSEKAMAPRSSTLAWKIPWMEEPGRLQSVRSTTEATSQQQQDEATLLREAVLMILTSFIGAASVCVCVNCSGTSNSL